MRFERMNGLLLNNAKIGLYYVITDVAADRVLSGRLEALGIIRGTRIKVINRNKAGSVILLVRGSRLALGSRIAGMLRVEEAV
jgi:ferrous iron transport protein A